MPERLKGEVARFDLTDKNGTVVVEKDKRITARHVKQHGAVVNHALQQVIPHRHSHLARQRLPKGRVENRQGVRPLRDGRPKRDSAPGREAVHVIQIRATHDIPHPLLVHLHPAPQRLRHRNPLDLCVQTHLAREVDGVSGGGGRGGRREEGGGGGGVRFKFWRVVLVHREKKGVRTRTIAPNEL